MYMALLFEIYSCIVQLNLINMFAVKNNRMCAQTSPILYTYLRQRWPNIQPMLDQCVCQKTRVNDPKSV